MTHSQLLKLVARCRWWCLFVRPDTSGRSVPFRSPQAVVEDLELRGPKEVRTAVNGDERVSFRPRLAVRTEGEGSGARGAGSGRERYGYCYIAFTGFVAGQGSEITLKIC